MSIFASISIRRFFVAVAALLDRVRLLDFARIAQGMAPGNHAAQYFVRAVIIRILFRPLPPTEETWKHPPGAAHTDQMSDHCASPARSPPSRTSSALWVTTTTPWHREMSAASLKSALRAECSYFSIKRRVTSSFFLLFEVGRHDLDFSSAGDGCEYVERRKVTGALVTPLSGMSG